MDMTAEDLKSKNELYQENIEDWKKYELVWRSGTKLASFAIRRHERESYANYLARLKDGYIFNFAKSVIDIYSFYLNEKKVIRILPQIEDDPQWQMFQKDADLNGTDYNVLINETQKFSSIWGSFGILINKAGGNDVATLQKEIDLGIYPYYALFSLSNIYDWKFEKNPLTHRRELVYLKLKEPGENYLIWYKDHWEQWTLENITKKPEMTKIGENPLNEIPFIWMQNIKDLSYPEIGCSDLVDIADIVISIIQNLSCGEEMIKLAGFPIMREPMIPEGVSDEEESEVGPRAVKDFDPTQGAHAKPDWMPTEIYEPVEATLRWIDRKTDEIYRVAHLSGVHGQRKSNNEVASGMALRYEFSQLNQVLNAKCTNQNEGELQALRYWLMWQDKEHLFRNVQIRRSSEFSIDELSIALENAIRGYQNVVSRTFRKRVMMKISEHVLPDLTQKDKEVIESEIESNLPEKTEIINGKMTDSTRDAYRARADHSKD
jgi:hypothetical protein